MKTFNVNVSFVFEGYCEVKAKSLEEAEEIVKQNMNAYSAQISDNGCDKIEYFDISIHANTVI